VRTRERRQRGGCLHIIERSRQTEETIEYVRRRSCATGRKSQWFDRFPEAAAKLADVRRQLIKARRRK
jgi:hypothetical protein